MEEDNFAFSVGFIWTFSHWYFIDTFSFHPTCCLSEEQSYLQATSWSRNSQLACESLRGCSSPTLEQLRLVGWVASCWFLLRGQPFVWLVAREVLQTQVPGNLRGLKLKHGKHSGSVDGESIVWCGGVSKFGGPYNLGPCGWTISVGGPQFWDTNVIAYHHLPLFLPCILCVLSAFALHLWGMVRKPDRGGPGMSILEWLLKGCGLSLVPAEICWNLWRRSVKRHWPILKNLGWSWL